MHEEDNVEPSQDVDHIPSHPWKARFVIGLIMVCLSFIGLVVTDIWKDGAWNYWRFASLVYAAMCMWLSWYLRKKQHSISFSKLWHEIIHWIALILAVFLFSLYTEMGIMGRFEAGLAILTLLALTIFLGGIYIEPSFLIIGILLGFFAAGAAFMATYLYTVMLPVALGAILLIFWLAFRKRKHPPKQP